MRETQTGADGYPVYRRRSPEDGGHSYVAERSQLSIDNSWVVPYNPVLSRMFESHINVEYCNSVTSIKYICKDINKGSDMAVIQRESVNRNDEITMYQFGRYLSTNEAFWRIFGFQVHGRNPAIQHLQVHLENGQRVYFRPERAHEVAQNPPATTLTGFFNLCRDAVSYTHLTLPTNREV